MKHHWEVLLAGEKEKVHAVRRMNHSLYAPAASSGAAPANRTSQRNHNDFRHTGKAKAPRRATTAQGAERRNHLDYSTEGRRKQCQQKQKTCG